MEDQQLGKEGLQCYSEEAEVAVVVEAEELAEQEDSHRLVRIG